MKKVVVIGAGPAGLTAAYELLDKSEDYEVTVLEESEAMGGICKTVNYKGNRMDMGGHRFFSKVDEVNEWWDRMLPMQGRSAKDYRKLRVRVPLVKGNPDPNKEDRVMLTRRRVSRIFFNKKFFDYPISLKFQTLADMGFITTLQVGISYFATLIPIRKENSLEDFYINRFGKPLYKMFFEGYTEKLWHYIILKESDMKIIQDKFLDGSLDIKEYDYEKVSKLEHDLFVVEMSENERFDCISKLSCTLYEYKNYLRYKDVIDEVKAIYNDKNNKGITKNILKEISKHEGKIVMMNKKIAFRRKLNKNANVEKFYTNMNTSLDELKRLYDEYDEALFKEKVVTLLNDNSSILDLLKLTLSYPINLAKIIKSKNEEITDEDLAEEIKYLERFVRYPNNTIVSNITILDERDLSLLILDKYRLMNIMLRVEQLEFVNLDNLISLVKKIFTCYIINRSNISYENLVSATEWKKILDRETIE